MAHPEIRTLADVQEALDSMGAELERDLAAADAVFAERIAFLSDLASRLMHVPAGHGVDQGDVDRLNSIVSDMGEML